MYRLDNNEARILATEFGGDTPQKNLVSLLVKGNLSNILLMPYGSVIKYDNDGFYLSGYTQDNQDVKPLIEFLNNK